MKPMKLRVVLCWCGILCLALLGLAWGVLGRSACEKLATATAMPAGLIWLLLTCVIIWQLRTATRRVLTLLILIWAAYTVVGNGMFSSALLSSLESEFSEINPLQEEPFDVVVLLGGGAATGRNGRAQGNASGDRVILAAQMYHSQLTSRIICTGQRIVSMNSTGKDPAEESANVLIGLGVPNSAIEKLGGRTTSEEMALLGQRYGNSESRVGVITSAWHLPRAMRLADRNGFHPQPLPADFLTGPPRSMTAGEVISACIPQGGSFMVVSRVAKEYLGMLAGR